MEYHNVDPNAASINVVNEFGNFSMIESNNSKIEYWPSTNEFDSRVELHKRNKIGISAWIVDIIIPA